MTSDNHKYEHKNGLKTQFLVFENKLLRKFQTKTSHGHKSDWRSSCQGRQELQYWQ